MDFGADAALEQTTERVRGDESPHDRRRPRVLLLVTGSVAAVKTSQLVAQLAEFAEVRTVLSMRAREFVNEADLSCEIYTDRHEWETWRQVRDANQWRETDNAVLHITLRRWADIALVAPLSANTLAKIAGGLCDNLITCTLRAWSDYRSVIVCPAMNTLMYTHPLTRPQLEKLQAWGAHIVGPIDKRLACGDEGIGAMAAVPDIAKAIRSLCAARDLCND